MIDCNDIKCFNVRKARGRINQINKINLNTEHKIQLLLYSQHKLIFQSILTYKKSQAASLVFVRLVEILQKVRE